MSDVQAPRSIWKFPLRSDRRTTTELTMPVGAHILAFQMQGQRPCLWVEVTPSQPEMEVRRFRINGTRHPIDNPSTYIGTAQDPPLVWHLYEVPLT